MGTAMAQHLLERGRTVSVWNRSEAAVQQLVDAGATPVPDRRALLATGLTFSMLANDAAVTDVFTEEVLAAAPEGAIHVNMATVGLPTADAMVTLHQKYGVTYIAAPVLGRPNVAAEGQLNIVAAGDEAAIAKVQPYLDLIGKRTWVVGEHPRAANLVKLAVNFNLIHAIQALAESLTLVEAGGVDSSTFVDILTDAAFTGSVYRGYGKLIADRDYDPKFTVALGAKDLGLLSNAADEHGIALPSVPMLRSVYEATLAHPELADLDWSATAEVTRRQHPLAQER